MMKMFIDPKKTLYTCREKNCKGCSVSDDITCHFSLKQYLHFLSIAVPPFVIGYIGLHGAYDWKILISWAVIMIAFFVFIEIRVMCSHCPHYAEPALKTLKCWANYGSPKLWKYNPGPMSKTETFVFLTGLGIVFLYPVPFLFLSKQWSFLLIYLLSLTAFFATLKMNLCTQCMNFACTLNAVPEKIRNEFFKKNPQMAVAWGKFTDNYSTDDQK